MLHTQEKNKLEAVQANFKADVILNLKKIIGGTFIFIAAFAFSLAVLKGCADDVDRQSVEVSK
jgi:hypothetical protein